jgi:hypothetical protein
MGGEDVVMTAFEAALDGKVLFTGFHGDKVWHYGTGKVSKMIVRGDASGGSLAEFRLRVGFIHLPIPFIGCLQHPSINEITMSSEMKEWYLHRDTKAGQIYNRPIPRRLAEEAGVPRAWFGQQKRAVTQPLAFVPRESWLSNLPLVDILSSASNRDFRRYLDSIRSYISKSRPGFRAMHLLYWVNQRAAWRLARLSNGKYSNPQKLIWFHWRYQYPLTEHLWGFHWGVQRIRQRYERPEAAK